MCRVITKLLVFFILSVNLAWATDMDELLAVGESGAGLPVLSQADGHGTGGEEHKVNLCDHCCHGSANYTGLVQPPITLFHAKSCIIRLPLVTALRSRDKEPPLQPPNI